MNPLFGNPAAPTFDDPLEMLRACHGRIEAQCATLIRLVSHLQAHGNDEQAVQAARAVLRYFDTAAVHHHQDEEDDLFPLLLSSGHPDIPPLIDHLLEEHKELGASWQALRPRLLAITEQREDKLDAQSITRLVDGYARHIARENQQLLPLAKTLLDAQQLQALGHKMASRRGVN